MSTVETPIQDQAKDAELDKKVTPRVSEARLIKVIDQSTLDAVGERLAINKALQKEVDEAYDDIISAAHLAHVKALAKKKKYKDPLIQEEAILKTVCRDYLVEQKRLADAEEARLLRIRQEQEREALRLAEIERQRKQAEINAQLEREHAEETERLLNSLPAETPAEDIQAICDEPAPVVEIPLEVPVFAPVRPVARPVMPQGMSMRTKMKAILDPALGEAGAIRLLCKAVGEGKVVTDAVKPDMTYLNKAVGAKLEIPGVKAVPDTGLSQRSR
jgi:hypothetical protein